MKDINEMVFPHVQEGDKILYNEKWYIYTNNIWVLIENN